MHTFSQWAHQHDFLLAGGALFAAAPLVPACRGPRSRWWAAWVAGLCLFVTAAARLRTPDAAISIPDAAPGDASYAELDLASVEAVEQAIRSVGRPVLVEVYADHGFS